MLWISWLLAWSYSAIEILKWRNELFWEKFWFEVFVSIEMKFFKFYKFDQLYFCNFLHEV